MNYRYLTTKDVCDRFRRSSRTLYRWMDENHNENPFPKPDIQRKGSANMWLPETIEEWETLEMKRAKQARISKSH